MMSPVVLSTAHGTELPKTSFVMGHINLSLRAIKAFFVSSTGAKVNFTFIKSFNRNGLLLIGHKTFSFGFSIRVVSAFGVRDGTQKLGKFFFSLSPTKKKKIEISNLANKHVLKVNNDTVGTHFSVHKRCNHALHLF